MSSWVFLSISVKRINLYNECMHCEIICFSAKYAFSFWDRKITWRGFTTRVLRRQLYVLTSLKVWVKTFLICKNTFSFIKITNTSATPKVIKGGICHQLLLAPIGEEWPMDVPVWRPPMDFPLRQSRTKGLRWPPRAGSFRKAENLETPDGFMRLGASGGGGGGAFMWVIVCTINLLMY